MSENWIDKTMSFIMILLISQDPIPIAHINAGNTMFIVLLIRIWPKTEYMTNGLVNMRVETYVNCMRSISTKNS